MPTACWPLPRSRLAPLRPEIALSSRFRWPMSTPSFSRSASVRSARTSASISFLRNAVSHWPRPRFRSQAPTSTVASTLRNRIVVRAAYCKARATDKRSERAITEWLLGTCRATVRFPQSRADLTSALRQLWPLDRSGRNLEVGGEVYLALPMEFRSSRGKRAFRTNACRGRYPPNCDVQTDDQIRPLYVDSRH